MTKVIAFCLWGSNPKYTIGAIRNVEIQKELFPDWTCRFYVDETSVPHDILVRLVELGAEVLKCGKGNWTAMFWRFFAAEDSQVMISRDTDSRLSEREKIAVDEWLESDKDFHIIRDHPAHGIEILGGMWGVRNGLLKNIRELIGQWTPQNRWQTDQEFLKAIVYPIVKPHAFVHDEFFNYNQDKHKIKHTRVDGEHIGGVFDAKDRPNQQHRNMCK